MLGTFDVVSDILQKIFFKKKSRGADMWLNLCDEITNWIYSDQNQFVSHAENMGPDS